MANHKRKKSRRHVKCCLCTPNRLGNSKKGQRAKTHADEKAALKEVNEALEE